MDPRFTRFIRASLLVILALLLAGCDNPVVKYLTKSRRAAPGKPAELSQLTHEYAAAVYKIQIYDGTGNEMGSGTGFAINAEGLLVTNYHVVKFAPSMVALSSNGHSYNIREITAYDAERDLALLQMDSPSPRYFRLAKDVDAAAGRAIGVIGGPLGLEGTVSEGIISAIRYIDEDMGPKGTYLQITAPISPGSSGSPVFLMDGRVVGVVVAELSGGQQLNFAIPASEIPRLQERAKEKKSRIVIRQNQVRGKDPAFEDELYIKGQQALEDGNISIAQERFTALLTKFPKSGTVHAQVGECLRREGRTSESLRFFHQALTLEKQVPWIWCSYGKALHLEQAHPQAIQAYTQAVKMDEADTLAQAGLGELLAREGRVEEAIKHYTAALEVEVGNVRWWRALGQLHVKQRQWEEGMRSARRALDLEPRDINTLLLARTCARGLGQPTGEFDNMLNQLGASVGQLPVAKARPNQFPKKPNKPTSPDVRDSEFWHLAPNAVNPHHTSLLLGSWRSRDFSISFAADGTFRANEGIIALTGSWSTPAPDKAVLNVSTRRQPGSAMLKDGTLMIVIYDRGGARRTYTITRR